MTRRRTTAPRAFASAEPFVPPYPPSWFDRLKTWVEALPVPPWAFYLLLGVSLTLAESAIQWGEGAYRPGTFDPWLLTVSLSGAYGLGLMHYLDRSAASALSSFRSLLVPHTIGKSDSLQPESPYPLLVYELTTLPPLPCLLATLAGAGTIVLVCAVAATEGNLPNYLAGSASTTLSTAAVSVAAMTWTAISGVLTYHTVRQLMLVSRIYTQHTRISVYQIPSLYSLSVPGQHTAIGLMLMLAVSVATSTALLRRTTAFTLPEVGIVVLFAIIGGATFVTPLLGAHRLLSAEKNRQLVENGSRLEAATARLHREFDTKSMVHIDKLNKVLATLEIEHGVLLKVPTWPWRPGSARSVLAAIMLPLLVWILQQALTRVFGA